MMRHILPSGLVLVLVGVAAAGAQENPGWALGMKKLYRLDLLPQLRESIEVGSVSSYDRTGGNDDGFSGKYSYVAREDDGLVIADLKGPGIIYRIWTPTPSDDMVEFYFDGETKPRIRVPFRDIFTGKHWPFVAPLTGYGGGGFYSYVPLAYRHSCKVKVLAKRVQFYQINFARYPAEAPVQTWTSKPSAEYQADQRQAAELFSLTGNDISEHAVPPGSPTTTVKKRVVLQAGAMATLFESEHGGRVVGLRISPAAALEGKQRDLVLRMRWDNQQQPAVLCPVGDFFGYAWGRPAMTSLLVGSSADNCYCYFPMPFAHSAKIELVSERQHGAPVELTVEVTTSPVPLASNEGRFHAVWRRENPTQKGQPFTFLETEGHGHVVGCILQAQGMVSGNTYFFEGDDQTTIDGDLAVHGTGSEDFFNGGWYDVPGRWEKRISFPLSGCLGYQKHLGRTGGYRLLLGDAYAFGTSIKQTIEHAATANNLLTDYVGVTYLYLQSPPARHEELPPATARRVVDFKRIIFTPGWSVPIHAFTFRGATLSKKDEQINGKRVSYLSMITGETDSFGYPFLSLVCDIPAAGQYNIKIECIRGPAQAMVQLFQNEAPVGDAVDLYAAAQTRRTCLIGDDAAGRGSHGLDVQTDWQEPRRHGLWTWPHNDPMRSRGVTGHLHHTNLVTPGSATSTAGAGPQAYRSGDKSWLEFMA